MKTKDIRQLLRERFGEEPGEVSLHKGEWTVRRGFFYTHGKTTDDLWQDVKTVLPSAKWGDSGEEWKVFNGGASIKASSHWWVRFTVT